MPAAATLASSLSSLSSAHALVPQRVRGPSSALGARRCPGVAATVAGSVAARKALVTTKSDEVRCGPEGLSVVFPSAPG